jgi:excisionase family DNA binding protein|tara:strand:+ start:1804 stop:1989 length:186 start_codon:yes stop_codon:yes gene_type:complete
MVKTQLKKGYYTPQEIADLLGVSRFSIWRYIRSGKLKAIKLTERNFRIEKKELDKFLKQSK